MKDQNDEERAKAWLKSWGFPLHYDRLRDLAALLAEVRAEAGESIRNEPMNIEHYNRIIREAVEERDEEVRRVVREECTRWYGDKAGRQAMTQILLRLGLEGVAIP